MARLDLVGLEKRFGATVAVAAFDLAIAAGEFVTLLGPSGCGKTTTLRMIAGFVQPTRGSIRIEGAPIENVPTHARNIGIVFQNYALFPHMSVAGNVGFGLEMRHVGRAEREARVKKALDLVGLTGLGERWPSQLSGGQQQRVALARTLVIEPDVLLLDEPLSNLDATLRQEMRSEIRALQRKLGITTVFVTHDQAEALGMSDRVVVMEKGRVVEAGAPVELSESPRRVFTASFLGARTVLPGRVEGGAFVVEGLSDGTGATIPADGAPEGADHLVLRAARLGFAPVAGPAFVASGTVTDVAYLGDLVETTVVRGPHAIRVVRPSHETPPALGAVVTVSGRADAVSFLADPGHPARAAAA
jgi:ABC-type Fe3+/spermidine/putrescine transport system ATPase subunit